MPAITKRVNINAPVAIKTIEPPIYGYRDNVIMRSSDILKCLCKRAIVDEILPNGKTVRLNMTNYYTDNGAGLYATDGVKKASEKEPEVKEEVSKKKTTTPAPKKEEPPIKFAKTTEVVAEANTTEVSEPITENIVEVETELPERSTLTEAVTDEVVAEVSEPIDVEISKDDEITPAKEEPVKENKPQYNKNTSKNKSKKK